MAAAGIFEDGFSFRDDSKWKYIDNGGLIGFDDDVLTLDSNGLRFPVVYGKFGPIFLSDSDTVLEVRFKYNNYASMGDGIGIGFTGFLDYPFFQFSLWQDTNEGSYFMYNDFSLEKYGECDTFVPYTDLVDRQYWPVDLSGNGWHLLVVKRLGTLYEIFLDGELLHVTESEQCIPSNLILGNPLSGGSYNWNSLSIDYVKVYSSEEGGVGLDKIIILPGLGASWNTRAMVYNEAVAVDDWSMTPFVKNYDGLVTALEAKEMEEGSDFFVWNYDWRQSMSETVDDFGEFVEEVTDDGEKVDLVGHSLGGLTARIWLQQNEDKVDKVISLGSPHQGAVGAYDAWSGGRISDKFDAQSIALNVLLQLQKRGDQTRLETIRSYTPVLGNLLPTFDFVKIGRRVLSVASLESQNDYLLDKNSGVLFVVDQLVAMVAVGEETKEWISLKPRSVYDKVLGIWPDGRPIRYSYGEGDGTVLAKSAKFDQGEKLVEVSSDHGQMVNDLVDEIFEELDLGEVTVVIESVEDLSSKTVFFVGSPVVMTVECEGDVYDANMGFVLIDGGDYSWCRINLLATDDGVYHLVMGGGDDWSYFEGGVIEGEEVMVMVDPGGGGLIVDELNEEWLYSLIERDLELLEVQFGGDVGLTGAFLAVGSKDVSGLLESIFAFRGRTEEMELSGRVVDNIELLLMIENEAASISEARLIYRRVLRARSLVDRKTRLWARRNKYPSIFGSMSYKGVEERLTMAKVELGGGGYGMVLARLTVALKMIEEGW